MTPENTRVLLAEADQMLADLANALPLEDVKAHLPAPSFLHAKIAEAREKLAEAALAAAGVNPQDPESGLCGGCRDLGPHRNVPGCDYYEPAPQEPSGDALRDAIDHVQGAVEFQDAINPEAVNVIVGAAILGRPKIQDPATTTLVAEAREWAKYDVTGAAKIVLALCDATDTRPAPFPDREKLIAEAFPFDGSDPDTVIECRRRVRELIASLAAAPVLDEAKLAEGICRKIHSTKWTHRATSAPCEDCWRAAGAGADVLRGGGR